MQQQPTEDVIVRPYFEAGKNKWELEIVKSKKKGTFGNYPAINIPYKQGATSITIKIENPEGSTWKFSDDPFWVNTGPNDPTTPSTVPKEIPPASVHKVNATTLRFVDKNKDKVTLHYTLNFVDASNQKSSSLDPIIQNGGGGEGMIGESMTAYYLIGAVVLAAVAILLIRRMMRARPQQQGPGGG